jgi:hypothetical protein
MRLLVLAGGVLRPFLHAIARVVAARPCSRASAMAWHNIAWVGVFDKASPSTSVRCFDITITVSDDASSCRCTRETSPNGSKAVVAAIDDLLFESLVVSAPVWHRWKLPRTAGPMARR